MLASSGKRKDGSEWDDPRVVQEDEGLHWKPGDVHVASGVDELQLLSGSDNLIGIF